MNMEGCNTKSPIMQNINMCEDINDSSGSFLDISSISTLSNITDCPEQKVLEIISPVQLATIEDQQIQSTSVEDLIGKLVELYQESQEQQKLNNINNDIMYRNQLKQMNAIQRQNRKLRKELNREHQLRILNTKKLNSIIPSIKSWIKKDLKTEIQSWIQESSGKDPKKEKNAFLAETSKQEKNKTSSPLAGRSSSKFEITEAEKQIIEHQLVLGEEIHNLGKKMDSLVEDTEKKQKQLENNLQSFTRKINLNLICAKRTILASTKVNCKISSINKTNIGKTQEKLLVNQEHLGELNHYIKKIYQTQKTQQDLFANAEKCQSILDSSGGESVYEEVSVAQISECECAQHDSIINAGKSPSIVDTSGEESVYEEVSEAHIPERDNARSRTVSFSENAKVKNQQASLHTVGGENQNNKRKLSQMNKQVINRENSISKEKLVNQKSNQRTFSELSDLPEGANNSEVVQTVIFENSPKAQNQVILNQNLGQITKEQVNIRSKHQISERNSRNNFGRSSSTYNKKRLSVLFFNIPRNSNKNKFYSDSGLNELTHIDDCWLSYRKPGRRERTEVWEVNLPYDAAQIMLKRNNFFMDQYKITCLKKLRFLRCLNCQQIDNHVTYLCRNPIVCPKCGNNHRERDCKSNTKFCVNCWGSNYHYNTTYNLSHSAADFHCMTYQSFKYQKIKTAHNYLHHENK